MSLPSVCNKLNGLEPEVPAALVRETAQEFGRLITELGGACEPLLVGYQVRMVDGNCLAGSQHRLAVLRDKSAGKSLVMYNPGQEMAMDVLPCEDGHAQERSLLAELTERVQAQDVFIMDRNFCVRNHLLGIADKGGYFVCRHHKQMSGANTERTEKNREDGNGNGL